MRSYLSLSLKAATMFDNNDSFMLCGLFMVENNGGGCVYVYMEVVCVCVCEGCRTKSFLPTKTLPAHACSTFPTFPTA